MTAALNLPDKQDWTVDDLASRSTDKVFTTDVPCPVTIDLPALTQRRRLLMTGGAPQL